MMDTKTPMARPVRGLSTTIDSVMTTQSLGKYFPIKKQEN